MISGGDFPYLPFWDTTALERKLHFKLCLSTFTVFQKPYASQVRNTLYNVGSAPCVMLLFSKTTAGLHHWGKHGIHCVLRFTCQLYRPLNKRRENLLLKFWAFWLLPASPAPLTSTLVEFFQKYKEVDINCKFWGIAQPPQPCSSRHRPMCDLC